ncbi:MAG: MoaD/ThiS family protein [Planctomycetaceae bacterium]
MPRVCFTPNLHKLIEVHEYDVPGSTLGEALKAVFQQQPRLESYILDEQRGVRRHINLFLDGELIREKNPLDKQINPQSVIYVMQALSGG